MGRQLSTLLVKKTVEIELGDNLIGLVLGSLFAQMGLENSILTS